MKPPPAPISVPKVPMANPTTTRIAASRPIISDRPDLGRSAGIEVRVGQPRALERVPPQAAAQRLERQDLLGRDVAQVDVGAEAKDEIPLLGPEGRLPEDSGRVAHAPE